MTKQNWITDKNGNRCSIEYWGSEEAAKAALASLENCRDCRDCSDCRDCGHHVEAAPVIPKIDNIHQRIYDAVTGNADALDMKVWHKCETTHCRAGWVVTLAGEAGRALERFHGMPLAAQLIYRESGYPINPARFYDSNEEAMEDMRRLAERERAK